MIIEGAVILSENQALTGTGGTSEKALDVLGLNGNAYVQPHLTVRLTSPFTAGTLTTVEIQTSDNADMSGATTAITYTIPVATVQTKPAVLLDERLPNNLKKYMQLKYTGTGMAGGKVWSSLATGVPMS